ncbi:hypothetical protein C1H70_04530 [Halomonas urumqiensis]|uniref:Uncharacterized protein n=1 Tax=Halomonas urumqiensis TaxID=1684789 RepID=A0A2N7UML4_9GAMM|nr:hypothetical protein C1H70_04530 [Halomonas urumqiensis]PTB02305.1 hypothetical protein C6V82_11510 [Halomonas urumqiensis]
MAIEHCFFGRGCGQVMLLKMHGRIQVQQLICWRIKLGLNTLSTTICVLPEHVKTRALLPLMSILSMLSKPLQFPSL